MKLVAQLLTLSTRTSTCTRHKPGITIDLSDDKPCLLKVFRLIDLKGFILCEICSHFLLMIIKVFRITNTQAMKCL